MSFFSEYIAHSDELIAETTAGFEKGKFLNHSADVMAALRKDLWFIKYVVALMKECRIVKLAGEQAEVFLGMPIIAEQDYSLLRAPFPRLYIEMVETPFTFTKYKDIDENITHDELKIRGVMIAELTPAMTVNPNDIITMEYGFSEEVAATAARFIQVIVYAPLPGFADNTFVATMAITKDGRVIYPFHFQDEGKLSAQREMALRILHWGIHIMNFLTSPAVILEAKEFDIALQKARQKKGKPPLPGWYEISYTQSRTRPKVVVEPGASGIHHGFRYDVRGHFMHFTKGRMAGRVIWCPPHQRGLQNELYKPKTYRVGTGEKLPPPTEIWKGE